MKKIRENESLIKLNSLERKLWALEDKIEDKRWQIDTTWDRINSYPTSPNGGYSPAIEEKVMRTTVIHSKRLVEMDELVAKYNEVKKQYDLLVETTPLKDLDSSCCIISLIPNN